MVDENVSQQSHSNEPPAAIGFVLVVIAAVLVALILSRDSSPANASSDVESTETFVFFRQPTSNAIVPPVFDVVMGAKGLVVEPSGEVNEGAGHFHILIDTDFIAPGEVIPADDNHIHYGDGSTVATLELPAGTHTLRLQFANGAHVALDGPQFRDEIVVRVSEGAPSQSVRFVTPTDGAVVPPTFPVIMAASGLIVEPSGPVNERAGHMHILVDEAFVEAGSAIPADETHLHYGSGVTETNVTLEPGAYTLRLQFANGAHIALEGEQFRDEINVTVAFGASAEQVMFTAPQDGAAVTSPFTVEWAASGLIVEPSGPVIREDAGHLHVLINENFVAAGELIPADETHLHFGGAQLSTELDLAPGTYTLRLQMGDGAHTALAGTEFRDQITITVE